MGRPKNQAQELKSESRIEQALPNPRIFYTTLHLYITRFSTHDLYVEFSKP